MHASYRKALVGAFHGNLPHVANIDNGGDPDVTGYLCSQHVGGFNGRLPHHPLHPWFPWKAPTPSSLGICDCLVLSGKLWYDRPIFLRGRPTRCESKL
jgi:hypothetical protein